MGCLGDLCTTTVVEIIPDRETMIPNALVSSSLCLSVPVCLLVFPRMAAKHTGIEAEPKGTYSNSKATADALTAAE